MVNEQAELVNQSSLMRTERIMVPGGWLYRTYGYSDVGLAIATTFVPKPGPDILAKMTD